GDMGRYQGSLLMKELEKLHTSIIKGYSVDYQQVVKIKTWLTAYVRDLVHNKSDLDCRVIMTLAPAAERLPMADAELGDAFAPAWESGRFDDWTISGPSLMASMRHYGAFDRPLEEKTRRRLLDAFAKQPWQRAGSDGDFLAAVFGCVYARAGLA